MYHNDYEVYPPYNIGDSNQKIPFMRLAEAGYLKEHNGDKHIIDPILQCPEDNWARNLDWIICSYGWNGCNSVLGAAHTDAGGNTVYDEIKKIKTPSRTIAFGESFNYETRSYFGGRLLWKFHISRYAGIDYYNIGIADHNGYYSLDLHGKNRQNYLLFDGHVETRDFWTTVKPGYKTTTSLTNWGRTGIGKMNMWEMDGEN
jgi:prepilin-type processing-associated H-X9-DG protein